MSTKSASLFETITPFPAPTATRLDTSKWFDASHEPSVESPIDEFRRNLAEINKLYLQADQRNEYVPMLGSLVYLGMVSAAEGYFRSLLRRLIRQDTACEANAATRMVTYGAAIHHDIELLPESLLEGVSLASAKKVCDEIRSLCDIQMPDALQQLFQNFEAISQVRHCGIHRFGKLGSQQALRLGIDKHKPLLEKPLALQVQQLQEIADALQALVHAVNSFCFSEILKRTHTASPSGWGKEKMYQESWHQDWEADKTRFISYYNIFASASKPDPSAPVRDVYDAFMRFIADYGAAQGRPKGATKPAAPVDTA
ncbi:hypothetical protein SAMN04488509_12118 [Aquimonas voraii]|uniref:Uncharacterized protein n=2 Tax=Aquimonas voraii TaxID=265719 RepID=A0A1G7A9M0_9GAMM|nr:hypothetical protein SAMN04488509_12118 [Aquimonas voraii]